jgi:hypothetical protein
VTPSASRSATAGIVATVDGRRLRLELPGSGQSFRVEPLPGRCGLALSRAFLAKLHGASDETPAESVFAEALGPENYALATGSHVQVFDGDGSYLRTAMPDAVMIEPHDDVESPIAGQRVRVIAAPCDGLDLRIEEIEELALAAFYWQSAAGSEALDEYLRAGAGRTGAAAAQILLEEALRRPAVAPAPPG